MNLKGWEEFTLKYDDKGKFSERRIGSVKKKTQTKLDERVLFFAAARTDQWLTSGQSLTEQGLTEKDAVQLKKRFFVNDVNIDRTDPVQLHLVSEFARERQRDVRITSGITRCMRNRRTACSPAITR